MRGHYGRPHGSCVKKLGEPVQIRHYLPGVSMSEDFAISTKAAARKSGPLVFFGPPESWRGIPGFVREQVLLSHTPARCPVAT
jgi:hypothetical protein